MNDSSVALPPHLQRYNRFLLLVAGLGGLLYGIDVGIIAGALPYMEATSGLNAGQLSFIVAAVLLGSVISTLFAGMLSDLMGRKPMMIISGVLFVASIPMIALAQGFGPLVMGRLLQGVSAGFIGVVIPLYLAECLGAANRGKGTGVFQWLLTLGIVAAAVIGWGFSTWIDNIGKTGTAAELFAAKDHAWRWIFWVSVFPGILFVLGAFAVTESPRWLFKRGKVAATRKVLLRSRTPQQAELEIHEMQETATAAAGETSGSKARDSLLSRRYVIPFILACVILACNQLTGINSIIGYNATILIQAGLDDKSAHLGYVILTLVNFIMTMGAVALVDKKGRKFLLSLGSAGIIVSLVAVGLLFHNTEKHRVDCRDAVQAAVADYRDVAVNFDKEAGQRISKDFVLPIKDALVSRADVQQGKARIEFKLPVTAAQLVTDDKEKKTKLVVTLAAATDEDRNLEFPVDPNVVTAVSAEGSTVVMTTAPKLTDVVLADKVDQRVIMTFDQNKADQLLGQPGKSIAGNPATLSIIYSVGDFTSASSVVRSLDKGAKIKVSRNDSLPTTAVAAFFQNPFADLREARNAPLKIENALITPVPGAANGWIIAVSIFIFIAFFAVGPGVCVWLALSELMPTRIRSNGMSIALLINQAVSTTIAAIFLPTVGKYGYSTMFFAFAGCTVIYFITAAFFLPETKGKTLEEIEEHFEGKGKVSASKASAGNA